MRAQFEGGAGRRDPSVCRIALACTFVAAFAIASTAPPAGAETPPVFYANNHQLTTAHNAFVATGVLTLDNTYLSFMGSVGVRCQTQWTGFVWNEHEHGVASNPIRGYGEVSGMTATSCNTPPSDLEYREHPYTYVVSAELPLDKTTMEAELCSEERKTQLSECPSSAERSIANVIREVGRERSVPRGSSNW
jgi:hypothetical protein